ncbi:hypothetical protein AnigIFM56816_011366 [Aspergillus niger]|nr:hypothetical protein AnigIFM56816_011366 [Aspergillus niger]
MQQPPQAQQLRYYQCPLIQGYITDIAIGRDAPQKPVDHAWHNILAHYFRTPSYTVEREAYLDDPRISKEAANVSVVNTRNNGAHEVIVVEAKKPTKRAPTDHKWDGVRQQLQDNMLKFRNRLGNVQTMYGVAAVGSRARFYVLLMNQNVLVSDTEDGFFANDEVLDLCHDEQRIHDMLIAKRGKINNLQNNY